MSNKERLLIDPLLNNTRSPCKIVKKCSINFSEAKYNMKQLDGIIKQADRIPVNKKKDRFVVNAGVMRRNN
jgi:hypothetical protein